MNDKITGLCCLEYGPYESGKTYALATLPDPIAIINTEPRDIRRVLGPFLDKKDIDVFVPPMFDINQPQKWYEWQIKLLHEWEDKASKNSLKYKSIAYDSLSYSMNKVKTLVEDAQHETSEWKTEQEKGVFLVTGRKTKDIGYILWDQVGGAMVRITDRLNGISKYGKYVVATAVNDKDSFPEVPFFQGRIYVNAYGGSFDFIGRVFPKKDIHKAFNLDKEGKETRDKFPPYIMFISLEGDFEAKCCDTALREKLMKQKGPYAPLDFTKIIKSMDVK